VAGAILRTVFRIFRTSGAPVAASIRTVLRTCACCFQACAQPVATAGRTVLRTCQHRFRTVHPGTSRNRKVSTESPRNAME